MSTLVLMTIKWICFRFCFPGFILGSSLEGTFQARENCFSISHCCAFLRKFEIVFGKKTNTKMRNLIHLQTMILIEMQRCDKFCITANYLFTFSYLNDETLFPFLYSFVLRFGSEQTEIIITRRLRSVFTSRYLLWWKTPRSKKDG